MQPVTKPRFHLSIAGVLHFNDRRLRALTRAEIKPLPMKETPKCGGPNDEVLSIEGTVERVREACSIVLVVLRMWEAKAQLVHGKMPPDGGEHYFGGTGADD